jgi:hypothetical protein
MVTTEDIRLWAEIGTAVGTLALAVATFWSVSRTNAVIRGEDRRHQQQFAPLVKLVFSLTGSQNAFKANDDPVQGFAAVNIGNGIAVNVEIEIEAIFSYKEIVSFGPPAPTDFPGMPLVGFTVPKTEPRSEPFVRHFSASAIEKDGEARFDEAAFRELTYSSPSMMFKRVRLDYEDMFGNRYATIYEPGKEPEVYRWIQPQSLRGS